MKKNVLITGASGNLGKATVEKFLNEGYQVLALVRPGSALEQQENKSLFTYDVELTNETSVNNVIAKIISIHHQIDVAILTVGGFTTGTIETTDATALHKMIDLNFTTAYLVARPVFKQMMIQSFGRIVFFGARPGLEAAEGSKTIAYALSKSLILKLSAMLNADANQKNIMSIVVVPGIIDTPENREAMPEADFSKWILPEEISSRIFRIISTEKISQENLVVKLY